MLVKTYGCAITGIGATMVTVEVSVDLIGDFLVLTVSGCYGEYYNTYNEIQFFHSVGCLCGFRFFRGCFRRL